MDIEPPMDPNTCEEFAFTIRYVLDAENNFKFEEIDTPQGRTFVEILGVLQLAMAELVSAAHRNAVHE